MNAQTGEAIPLIVFGVTLVGVAAWLACMVIQTESSVRALPGSAKVRLAIYVALVHVGLVTTARAANQLPDGPSWTSVTLVLANVGVAGAYIGLVAWLRRLDAALSAFDRYKLSWRDARDTLLFLGGLGAMALATLL